MYHWVKTDFTSLKISLPTPNILGSLPIFVGTLNFHPNQTQLLKSRYPYLAPLYWPLVHDIEVDTISNSKTKARPFTLVDFVHLLGHHIHARGTPIPHVIRIWVGPSSTFDDRTPFVTTPHHHEPIFVVKSFLNALHVGDDMIHSSQY